MKRRIVIGALLAALAFSMAACGSTGGTDGAADGAGQETELNQGAAKEEVEKEEAVPYAAGVWTDNVYTNESLGMTFPLPEGWQYGTQEELAAMMGSGQEVTGYTDEELSATDPIYDLYIYNNSTGASIMMMAEDMSVYGDISAEEYLESVSSELGAFEDQGITYQVSGMEPLTIGKTEFVSFDASAEYQGVPVYQQYAAVGMSDRVVTIIMSAPGDGGQAECEAILASMQPTE